MTGQHFLETRNPVMLLSVESDPIHSDEHTGEQQGKLLYYLPETITPDLNSTNWGKSYCRLEYRTQEPQNFSLSAKVTSKQYELTPCISHVTALYHPDLLSNIVQKENLNETSEITKASLSTLLNRYELLATYRKEFGKFGGFLEKDDPKIIKKIYSLIERASFWSIDSHEMEITPDKSFVLTVFLKNKYDVYIELFQEGEQKSDAKHSVVFAAFYNDVMKYNGCGTLSGVLQDIESHVL